MPGKKTRARPTNLDAEIGRQIRQARLSCNLTQKALAECLGISFQQVQKYENGNNRVSASKLWEIAITLNTPIVYFYDALQEDKLSEDAAFDDKSTLPDATIKIARIIEEMPDGSVKQKFVSLIKAFANEYGVNSVKP